MYIVPVSGIGLIVVKVTYTSTSFLPAIRVPEVTRAIAPSVIESVLAATVAVCEIV